MQNRESLFACLILLYLLYLWCYAVSTGGQKMTDVIKPLFQMFLKYIPDIIEKSEKLDENLKIQIPIEEQIVVL